MPELLPSQRAAGARAFTADPHNGRPCDCVGAAALLRHRTLPSPDQSRYGHGKPVRFNRRRSRTAHVLSGSSHARADEWEPDGVHAMRLALGALSRGGVVKEPAPLLGGPEGGREAARLVSKERLSPCPYHTTLANGRLFGPRHPCFTVYDAPVRPEGIEPPTTPV